MAVLISKGCLHISLAWGGSKLNGSLHPPAKSSKFIHREALAGFGQVYRAGILNTTLLSHGCVLGAVSESKKGERNSHFKDTGASGGGVGGEEPLSAWVQLTVELAVMSF